MRIAKSILASLVWLSICGCLTTKEALQESSHASPSTFVHPFTKFAFPKSVGVFRRVEIQKYDQKGKDVGVGYNSEIPIATTVFIYPGPSDLTLLPSPRLANVSEAILNQHFQICKEEISRAHVDAKLINEGPCEIVQGQNKLLGKKVSFSLNYKFGFTSSDSISELYIFVMEPDVKFLATERQFVKISFYVSNGKENPSRS